MSSNENIELGGISDKPKEFGTGKLTSSENGFHKKRKIKTTPKANGDATITSEQPLLPKQEDIDFDLDESSCKSLRPCTFFSNLCNCININQKRFSLLATFFFFSCLLPILDILTDLILGINLITHGDVYWGTSTLLLILAPFCVVVLFHVYDFVKTRHLKKPEWTKMDRVKDALRYLPFLPLINLRYFYKLVMVDTNDSANYASVEFYRQEALTLSIVEGFVESGPQFILQLSIILRHGFMGYGQIFSIITSWLSLSMSATKAFFSKRENKCTDPNPSILKMTLPTLPYFLILSSIYLSSWAFILAYARGYIIIVIAFTFLIKGLLAWGFKTKKSLKDLGLNDSRARQLAWESVFTSTIIPCIVAHANSNLLWLSSLTTSVCLVLWTGLLNILVLIDPLEKEEMPPVSYCFAQNDTALYGQLCIYPEGKENECNQSVFRICDDMDCCPTIRFCDDGEHPLAVNLYIFSASFILLFVSVLVYWKVLTKLADYYNFFKYTSALHMELVHRSLIFELVEKNDPKGLEKLQNIIKNVAPKELCNMTSRSNNEGDTPLHVSCKEGYEKFARLLIREGRAKLHKRNSNGDTPLHIAAAKGYNVCAEPIVEKDLSTMYSKDRYGKLPIHRSLENEKFDVMEYLASKGSLDGIDKNFSASDADVLNALKCWQEVVVNTNNQQLLDYILANRGQLNDFDIDKKLGDNQQTLLHLAVLCGRRNMVQSLIKSGANHLMEDKNGKLPIHLALELTPQSAKNCISMLIDCNSYENNSHFEDPKFLIFQAAEKRQDKHCYILLEQAMKGVEWIFKDCEVTKTEKLINKEHPKRGTLGHIFAKTNRKTGIEKLFKFGMDPNLKITCENNNFMTGDTLIHTAARAGNIRSLEILVSRSDIDMAACNNYKETALHVACKEGQTYCVKELVLKMKNFSNLNIKEVLEMKDQNGDTALSVAAFTDYRQCMNVLIKDGAHADCINNSGETSIHRAIAFFSESKERNEENLRKTQSTLSQALGYGKALTIRDKKGRLPWEAAKAVGAPRVSSDLKKDLASQTFAF